MSEKLPQSTDVLIKRLRRVAKFLRSEAGGDAAWLARANTCDQAAGRLDDLAQHDFSDDRPGEDAVLGGP